MANVQLLEAARRCLAATGGAGTLLVQSNVEDVAVTLREAAESRGWEAVEDDGSLGPSVDDAVDPEGASTWLPRRQLRHVRLGGRRAAGPGWLAASPLAPEAASETERYYLSEGLPIHRVALRPRAAG
ncbi:unnamed protein product, partial [Prorocentrum cordatum]